MQSLVNPNLFNKNEYLKVNHNLLTVPLNAILTQIVLPSFPQKIGTC